jgi:NitT/TauT family transport system permease protein
LRKIAFYTALIAIWALVYKVGVDVLQLWKSYAFPSPMSVAESIVKLMENNVILIAIAASLKRLVIGYGLSILLGLSVGFLLYRFKLLEEALSPVILGLQALPSVCWIPFAMLWFGIGESAIIFVTAMGSLFAIAIATESAIKNIHPLYVKAAKTMGASGNKLFLRVIIPAAFPSIVSGLKQGWAFAWRSLIAGEMIASTTGLGHTLMVGRDLQDIGRVVAVMFIIIAIGLLLDRLIFAKVEKRIRLKWGLN